MFCISDDFDIYGLIYDLESYLRFIVRWELRGTNYKDWKGLLDKEVLTNANSRLKQEQEIGYLDIRFSGILSYLHLSELKDLILGPLWKGKIKENWGSKELVAADFKKLIAIRNKIAHFRPVTRRDTRIAKQFSLDLADWTKIYKKIRRYAICGSIEESNIKLVFKGKDKVIEYWLKPGNIERGNKYNIHIAKIDTHYSIIIENQNGTIEPESFIEFVTRHDKEITFCRVNKLGNKVDIYFPKELDENEIIKLYDGLFVCISNTVEPLSSMDVVEMFFLRMHEGMIPWEIEVPSEFVPRI